MKKIIQAATVRLNNHEGEVVNAKGLTFNQTDTGSGIHIGPTWRHSMYGTIGLSLGDDRPEMGVTSLDLLMVSYMTLCAESADQGTLSSVESAMNDVLDKHPEYMTSVPGENAHEVLSKMLQSIQTQAEKEYP